jgi:hypothetical protein
MGIMAGKVFKSKAQLGAAKMPRIPEVKKEKKTV